MAKSINSLAPTSNSSNHQSPATSSVSIPHPPLSPALHSSREPSVAQTLDSIHTTASKTDTLTTFDFDPGESPSQNVNDAKSLAGEFQSGLTGLYSRLKASVSGPSHNTSSPPYPASASESADDLASKTLANPALTTFKPSSLGGLVSPLPTSAVSSRVQSPSIATFPESATSKPLQVAPQKSSIVYPSAKSGPVTPVITAEHKNQPVPNPDLETTAFDTNDSVRLKHDNETNKTSSPSTSTAAATSEAQSSLSSLVSPARRNTKESLDLLPSFSFPSKEHHHLAPIHQGPPSNPPGFSISRGTSVDGDHSSATSQSGTIVLDGLTGRRTSFNNGEQSRRQVQFTPEPFKDAPLKNKLMNPAFFMNLANVAECSKCSIKFSNHSLGPFVPIKKLLYGKEKFNCEVCGVVICKNSSCRKRVDGKPFGKDGKVSLCFECETEINFILEYLKPKDEKGYPESDTDIQTLIQQNIDQEAKKPVAFDSSADLANFQTPSLAIPISRKSNDKRGSAILEFDNERVLSRPSSSRSLKSHRNNTHRRTNSKQLPNSRFHYPPNRSIANRAPFQKDSEYLKRSYQQNSNYIIDSDFEPLSDDMSEDDGMFASSNNTQPPQSPSRAPDKFGLDYVMGTNRRKPWQSDKGTSIASRDGDIGNSNVLARSVAKQRRRNFSTTSLQLSPKRTRSATFIKDSSSRIPASPQIPSSPPSLLEPDSKLTQTQNQSVEDDAYYNDKNDKEPHFELNPASHQHLKRLLRQMLHHAGIPHVSKWEVAIEQILHQCVDKINPDMQADDVFDIRHYIKLKKILGGKPKNTNIVSGVVFTKNVALKSMPRSIAHPRVLIVAFPIEYSPNRVTMLGPVVNQEREFLGKLVDQITTLKPTVLLAKSTISGIALQLLDSAKITVVQNVKQSVLIAVSRCTDTIIVETRDQLSMDPAALGQCKSFDVRTYLFHKAKKSFIYFSGCRSDLGCTIILRGTRWKHLQQLKRITEFMCYVTYHLKLEACFLQDENVNISMAHITSQSNTTTTSTTAGTSLNDSTNLSSEQSSILNSHPLAISDRTAAAAAAAATTMTATTDSQQISTASSSTQSPLSRQATLAVSTGESLSTKVNSEAYSYNESTAFMATSFYNELVEEYRTTILSASPYIKFEQPYLLAQAREQEAKLVELKKRRDDYIDDAQAGKKDEGSKNSFVLVQSEMVHKPVKKPTKQIRDFLFAVHHAEYESAKHAYVTQKRQWEAFLQNSSSLFDPYNHQTIPFLFILVNSKSYTCEGPVSRAIECYVQHDERFLPDVPIGEYVRNRCESGHKQCEPKKCTETMYEHHLQYVHDKGQITISLRPYPQRIPGFPQSILMWSVCRVCGVESPVNHMSQTAEKFSFGKYLEMTFSSTGLVSNAQECPHDVHCQHVRFLQYNNVAVQVKYDVIDLFDVAFPRTTVAWTVDKDLRLKNELYNKFKHDLDRFFKSVTSRIESINEKGIFKDKTDEGKVELQKLRQVCAEDHDRLTKDLQQRYTNSRWYQIIDLNKAARAIQENSLQWDERFSSFEKNFFPSEKDIRRITAVQIRSIFEKVIAPEDKTEEPAEEEKSSNEKMSKDEALAQEQDDTAVIAAVDVLVDTAASMSPKKTNAVLELVSEEENTQQKEDDAPQQTDVDDPGKAMDSAILSDQKKSGQVIQSMLLPPPALQTFKSTEDTTSSHTETLIPPRADLDSNISPKTKPTNSENPPEMNLPESRIPRPIDPLKRAGLVSPALVRAHSTPFPVLLRPLPLGTSTNTGISINPLSPLTSLPDKPETLSKSERFEHLLREAPRALARRIASKSFSKASHSLIPRSVDTKMAPDKRRTVMSLAKHYDQLSREFEKQRVRERQLRELRAFPLATSKPVVEVYRNELEAAKETESLENILNQRLPSTSSPKFEAVEAKDKHTIKESDTADQMDDHYAKNHDGKQSVESGNSVANEVEAGGLVGDKDDADEEHDNDDDDDDAETDGDGEGEGEDGSVPSVDEANVTQIAELAKDQKSSIFKLLTNFWGERSSSGWAPLDYPFTATEHFWDDTDIVVREDEPSSIIALALASPDYQAKTQEFRGLPENPSDDEIEESIINNLIYTENTNIRYAFENRGVKAQCKIFYAESFDAVRRRCGVSERFIESLSRCKKWNSKGGKTKSLFLKTLDERFILKSLPSTEVHSFFRFAPAYFRFVKDIMYEGLTSVIAKMFGLFQVTIRSPSGLEFNYFMLCIENLFYDRVIPPGRTFDLKGSMRNRKIKSTGESDEVLLDENLLDIIFEKPIFVRDHTHNQLTTAVHNDTLFLSKQNIMDYSLMAGFDDKQLQIVVGIIDCIRTYTLDKKLETWIKDLGSSQRPTVTSPKDYKKRFRMATKEYILLVPDCWQHSQELMVQGGRRMRVKDREDGVRPVAGAEGEGDGDDRPAQQ